MKVQHREDDILPSLTLSRSQNGPTAGAALSATPSNFATCIDSPLRVLLLGRLRLPLPPVSRTCRCGRLLDSFGQQQRAVKQECWGGEVYNGKCGRTDFP